MAKPTQDDAKVMLKLVQMWPVEETNWIWTDDFVSDPKDLRRGEEAWANVRGVLNWYETIGTLYKHELLSGDLLFDWLATDAVWERVKNHALAWREESGNPGMYENFEAMAEANRRWAAERQRKAA